MKMFCSIQLLTSCHEKGHQRFKWDLAGGGTLRFGVAVQQGKMTYCTSKNSQIDLHCELEFFFNVYRLWLLHSNLLLWF